MYTNTGEVGLGSPAVVNDVVFVSTGKPGLYALSTATGLCLWAAPGLGGLPAGSFILGPAVSGDWVVVGCANAVKAYSFPLIIWPWPLPFPIPIPQIGPIPELGPLQGG
jgi:outer membrane protein assembly factor BamB